MNCKVIKKWQLPHFYINNLLSCLFPFPAKNFLSPSLPPPPNDSTMDQQLLTGEDNSKNKKTLLLRKDPIFDKNENKTEDQKFSHQSRLNYDCKEFIPGKKYFSDDLPQSSNYELNKNYQSDGEVSI